jgi:hypothetical protein
VKVLPPEQEPAPLTRATQTNLEPAEWESKRLHIDLLSLVELDVRISRIRLS